jgi:hypothetical protein
MTRIIRMLEVRDRIASLDLIPVDPQAIEYNQRYIAAETRKLGDLIRKLGLAGSQQAQGSGIGETETAHS